MKLLSHGESAPCHVDIRVREFPFGLGGATWKADPTPQNAAWELYVELVPRSRWMRNETLSTKR